MQAIDLVIADDIVTNSLNLNRFTASEQKKVIALLHEMRDDLRAKIINSGGSDTRSKKLLSATDKIIEDTYEKINSNLNSTLPGVVEHEAAVTTQTLIGVGLDATMPTEAVLKAVIDDSLIFGSQASAWWDKQSDSTKFSFSAQVRQGIVQGENNQKIIERIMPILNTSYSNASALVHSSVQTAANEARLATFRAHADIIKGVEQLSTLDSHTSIICVAYSGAKWDLSGNPIMGTTLDFNGGPPRHFNCRSVLIPITKSFRDLGIDMDEFKETTRFSDLGQIDADISFSGYLDRKTKEQQDDLLGVGRADLWRAGKITLSDLVNQRGRPLTLAQLRKKYN